MGNPLRQEQLSTSKSDDFILTISSDDELALEDDAELAVVHRSSASSSDKLDRKRSLHNGAAAKPQSRKRLKLASAANEPSYALQTAPETQPTGQPVDHDNEQSQSADDLAFDSDFEFGAGDQDNFAEPLLIGGSWNSSDQSSLKDDVQNYSAGVDKIINRRKLQLELQKKLDQSDSHGSESDMSETWSAFDENATEQASSLPLVPSSANVAHKVDQEHQSIAPRPRSHPSRELRNGDTADDDEDEIALPTPHPDDLDDDNDSERTDSDAEMRQRQAEFFDQDLTGTITGSDATTSNSFQTMSLSRPILKGLSAVGFTSPTPIQSKTIPVALQGKDVVGGAVTGSGKTAAFTIPILERLLYRPRKVPTSRVAVLMPTRELAVQCYNVAIKLASFTDVSFALLVGGLSLREQEQTLKKRPDVIVATPGRFIDHMRNSPSFAVENIEILVLDEADRMLEDGFADELNQVLATIPKSRQTMLFSATMTQDVDQLIRAGLNKPVRVMIDQKQKTVQELTQEFIKIRRGKREIDDQQRLAYLLHLCSSVYTEKTIIFFPRKTLAHRAKILFALKGIPASELHGSMSQDQRLAAITSFQTGLTTHLLATDLASRGLDIPKVETVINYTVPTTTTTYLHRVGRTARAGRSGVSCTLFAPVSKDSSSSKSSERSLLRPILRLARGQGVNIRTRKIPQDVVNEIDGDIVSLNNEIDSILKEEKEEKLLQQTERDLKKGENLVNHQEEIFSRPKRTWFQTEKDKRVASKLGKDERVGTSVVDIQTMKMKKEKQQLSGKKKKKLQDRDTRNESRSWKKGKSAPSKPGSTAKPHDQHRKKKQRSKNP